MCGWLVLLGAGNYISNASTPGREVITFLLVLVGSSIAVALYRARFDQQTDSSDDVPNVSIVVRKWRGPVLFAIGATLIVAYVSLTGNTRSPLFCLLYIIPLLAALRFDIIPALTLSLLLAGVNYGQQFVHGHIPSREDSAIVCFPLAALFGAALRSWQYRRFRAISEQVNRQNLFIDISGMLAVATNLETTISLIVINARQLVDADYCAVYLLDSATHDLRLASRLDGATIDFSENLSVKALESGDWRMVSDQTLVVTRRDDNTVDIGSDVWPEPVSGNAMFTSLIGSEGVVGLLYVARARARAPFTAEYQQSLRDFAKHISMPLQKARYQETLSDLAFKDVMTDLANFRYFEQRLNEEFTRAKRYQNPITLLLLDIDHFKNFNDVYGHKAGDALLRQFGAVLKDCLRESDIPARYGGEEFIAMCPGITTAEAKLVAERIRTAYENTEFNLGETLLGDTATVRITVSIGTASYPTHASEPTPLIRQADRALYAAKERGRNITVNCDDIPTIDETIASRTAA
jgi:diguanylate cyclase (GGDEF)-like protein